MVGLIEFLEEFSASHMLLWSAILLLSISSCEHRSVNHENAEAIAQLRRDKLDASAINAVRAATADIYLIAVSNVAYVAVDANVEANDAKGIRTVIGDDHVMRVEVVAGDGDAAIRTAAGEQDAQGGQNAEDSRDAGGHVGHDGRYDKTFHTENYTKTQEAK